MLVPLFLALSATVFFTLTNFSSRYFVEKGYLSSTQLLADSCIVQSIVLMTVFMLIPNPFSLFVVASIGLVSIVGAFGNYLVTESIVHGKAGPTSALCEV